LQKLRVFIYWTISIFTFLFLFEEGLSESIWNKKNFVFQTLGFNHSSNNLPKLSGPEIICNAFGSVLASYSGGGNPIVDIYRWKITDPFNLLVFDRSGGATFQEISYTFSKNGTYKIELSVIRGGIEIHSESKTIEVIQGPSIILNPAYSFCDGENVSLSALSTSDPNFSRYTFEWFNEMGSLISSQNSFSTTIQGQYTVSIYILDSEGNKICETQKSTQVSKIKDYTISASQLVVCPDLPTNLSSSSIIGDWSAQKNGSLTNIFLGYGNSINLVPNQQLTDGEGIYTITFTPDPAINPSCLVQKTLQITYNPQPEFIVFPSKDATDCDSFNGTLTIEAITDLDFVIFEGLGITTPSIPAGQTFTVGGLKSGTYSLIGVLGNCSNGFGSLVPLENPPTQLLFSIENIEGEKCLADGKSEGSFILKFENPPSTGSYRVINQKGTLVKEASFINVSQIPISIPGGVYFVEVLSPNDCNIPESKELQIPSLTQSQFSGPTNLTICQSFEFTPQTNQNLEFTLINPAGIIITKSKGAPFLVDQEGEYQLIGKNLGDPTVCPSSSKFDVKLVDPIEYEPKLIEQDCFGNRTYEADIKGVDPNTVKFQWFNEKNQLVGTGQFLNPVSIGTFKLDVQPLNSSACPIPPKEFEITDPILSVEVSLSSTKLCEFGPRAILNLTTTFPEEITDVEWRRYDEFGVIEALPQFKNQYQIIADQEGVYEAAVFSRIPGINKNCELGRNTLQLDLIPEKIEFSIPGDLSICDPYELVPQSTISLEYTLTFPDGKVETNPTGEAFTLDQVGTYTLLGIDLDPKGPKCPEQKTFEVKINQPVQFQPILQTLNCDGSYDYLAKVDNYPPDQVDYFWKDQSGNLLGSTAVFTTSTYGSFTLEVQPKGSIPCGIDPVGFDVAVPVLKVDVNLVAEPLCPDQPNAALRAEADLTPVSSIEWWFTDINNTRRQLTTENNKKEILASLEGTYEVILKNSFNCAIGIDQVLILRSTDQVRPTLEENYLVCPNLEIGPTLNPGQFASYNWYFEGNLISSSPTFKPLQVGNYQVVVQSQEGCVYQATFTTQEECELKLRLPSAMQPENPEKPFLIYTNYLVDELELWIFNKWGNLIFYCENSSLIDQESTCLWDGTYQGQKVPPGAYSYRINYKNLEKNIQKVQLGTVLILD
jgi:hypothetical protein